MSVQEYKCPNCSGKLPFDSLSGKMKCPYCGAEFDAEVLTAWQQSQESMGTERTEWENYDKTIGSGDWQQEELDSLDFNECPSCGASVIGDKNTIAVCCPYCGNSNIIKARAAGIFKPDYVIPFKLDKKAAMQALEFFQKGKPLLPSSFKTGNRIEEIQAVYVPFWLFDCDVRAKIHYRATKVSSWTTGTHSYTKTDVYNCIREGELTFEKIPADGSDRMDNTLMDTIEPFDYSDIKEFNTAYLSGFLAEKYDVDAEQNKERINQRIRNSVEQHFRRDIIGYSSVQAEASKIDLEHGKIRYALFPVWMVTTMYKDKRHTFAMNGQTGKVAGSLPISTGRSAMMIFSIFAGLMALFSTILFFVM